MYQKIIIILALSLLFLMGCGKEPQLQQLNDAEPYIVVLKEQLGTRSVQLFNESVNLKATKVFTTAFRGGVYYLTSAQVVDMARDPRVAYVEKDHIVSINAVQSEATWGLDRIDQQDRNLDGQYKYDSSGEGVNAYIIDTGILTSHIEFEGRATHGVDTIDNDSDATDCNGHGTHVAGTVGSKSFGVAKKVNLVGVRVLNCSGSGRYSNVIEGIEWVTENHIKPAVVNMSLGGPVSQAVDDAILASIASGVTYVVAAGNSNINACNTSPSRVGAALTVGSSSQNDTRSSFSNYGECVDIFAPGKDVTSTWFTGESDTSTISGTSMASPHVAGAVALVLEKQPNAQPLEISQILQDKAVSGTLSDVQNGSPNLLLNTEFVAELDEDVPIEDSNPVLQPGKTVQNLSDINGGEKVFAMEIPEHAHNLKVRISGGSGDADLYVRASGQATLDDFDCRPYKNGNEEECVFENPVPGTYSIMIRGYLAYSGLNLTANYSACE